MPRLAFPRTLIVSGGGRRRRLGRRRHGWEVRAKFFFDGLANLRDRRARRPHLPRPGCHVDAHGALQAVFFPFNHVAVLGARTHETVRVSLVTTLLTAAEAGNVAGHLGMFGRELERGRDDFDRPRWSVSPEGNG